MHRVLLAVLLLSAVFATGGCAWGYESNRRKLMSGPVEVFGPEPPADHVEREKALVLSFLKDPESARFRESGEPPKREAISPGMATSTALPVWVTTLDVNAKNSYGGYTGFERYSFAWQHGEIVRYGTGSGRMVFWIDPRE